MKTIVDELKYDIVDLRSFADQSEWVPAHVARSTAEHIEVLLREYEVLSALLNNIADCVEDMGDEDE